MVLMYIKIYQKMLSEKNKIHCYISAFIKTMLKVRQRINGNKEKV